MPIYNAPLDDYAFVLNHVLPQEKLGHIPGWGEHSTLAEPLWQEAARLAQEVLFPLNQVGDREGLKYDNGAVITPAGFKDAYRQYAEGGWMSFTCDPNYGGQGLPEVLNMPVVEMLCSANLSFGMTPGLTHGAVNALTQHASDELKQKFLPKMISGEWAGVMCLTEPQCGTDLGLIRTTATPNGDGSFAINGTKIFISSGEQDLTENIVHLVLARLPDAPKGTKGISLFVLAKRHVNADGSSGDTNGVHCSGIEHKMGIHASPTCVMQYEGAQGWLVGEPHKGLRAMFTMMNEARLYVGMQGLGLAEVATQNAIAYAKDRLQGRAVTGAAFPDKPADPLTVHADVRRMLLSGTSFCEAARAMAMETALMLDLSKHSEDKEEREEADAFVQLATPILKAYFTDMGFEVTNHAVQVHGGHGYISEYGVEQYVRDARIAQIYEGANGIQALDLVGRKLPQNFGRNLRAFFHPATAFIEENRDNPDLAEFTKPLYVHVKMLQQVSLWMVKAGFGNPEEAVSGATDYLRLFALVWFAYYWVRMAKAALALKDSNPKLAEHKLANARFFLNKVLPMAAGHAQAITAGRKPLATAELF
jgi:alkylation response protein AidB-like acyl-CoA dehydrogenase